MTRTRSLRVQLTATFVGIGAVLVAAGYGGAAWLLRRAVWSPLDATLRAEAKGLALVRESEADEEGTDGEGDEGLDDLAAAVARLGAQRDLGADEFVTVTSAAGPLIASSGHPPSNIRLSDIESMDDKAVFFRDGPQLYRAVSRRVPDVGWITIGIRADGHMAALRRALTALRVGAIVMLGGIGLLAWAITTRATKEIDALTNELEELEADSIARRLDPRSTTEVARLAEALNRLLGRLEVAVRRLQRFTADAAHELRTPIAALRAHLDVALARPRSIDGYRNGLLDASEQTERLAALAEDLLTLSAIESADLMAADAVDVGVLANEVAEFLEAVAEEQQREFTVLMDSPATVRGEALLLKRLLLNLLGNAFAHTPHGTPVRLTVRRIDSGVEVTVRDHGPGISPDVRRVLFERFASRRTGAGGAGLGLAICREIVARHKGAIALESAVDQGTTVTVRLPA